MDLNELQARVYQTAQAKGWHDGRPNGIPYRETRALIVSELSEALEEFRAGRMDVWHQDAARHALDGLLAKPEGFPIELADTAIRVLHRTGAAKRTWDEYDHRYITGSGAFGTRSFPDDVRTVPEQIDWLIETAIKIDIEAIFLARLNVVARVNDIDLWAAVELKAKYNETRPYKHGNKRA